MTMVYILEAHAQDEWPIRSSRSNPSNTPVLIDQQKTLEERMKSAKEFREIFGFQMNILIDDMDNSFEKNYASWPIRFFVVSYGKLKYIAQPENQGYFDFNKVEKIIDEFQ